MPFIVGAPRSGTTLLRFMIDAHPSIAIPPETGFLTLTETMDGPGATVRHNLFRQITHFPPTAPAWPDFGIAAEDFQAALERIEPFDLAEGVRAFYRLYAQAQNKPRYGDKTPIYCDSLRHILKLLPEARFIHIIRDGRDVLLSLRHMWFAPGQDIRTLALYWRTLVRNARESGLRSGAYMEVRYEDLVRDPRPVLEAVCRFVQLDFDACMLRYWQRTPHRLLEHRTRYRSDGTVLVTHETRLAQQALTKHPPQPQRIGRWKTEMTEAERLEFIRFAGDTLEELGYELEA